MRTSAPRIPPLPQSEWNGDAGELIAPAVRNGKAPNLYTTLARHPEAMRHFVGFVQYIRKSTLAPREQEILILRIGWLCRSGYEWNAHNWLGKRAGLQPEEIARIKEGADAAGWSPQDRGLCEAAEQLHRDQFISDATWNALRGYFTEQQCMDIVFTATFYILVSAALNSFGIQFDEGAALAPDVRSAWNL